MNIKAEHTANDRWIEQVLFRSISQLLTDGVNVQKVVYFLHRLWVGLRTGQLLLSLSLMAHAVQVTPLA